jgi:dienelactone hydrolase
MGAGMTMRAFATNPAPFSGAMVFHNATIGTWQPEIEANTKILAYHEVDPDHMREAVCSKNLSRMANSNPRAVTYIDNARYREQGMDKETLDFDSTGPLPRDFSWSRSSDNSVSFKAPSSHVLRNIIAFFNTPVPAAKNASFQADVMGEKHNITAVANAAYDSTAENRFDVFVKVRPLLAGESASSMRTGSNGDIAVRSTPFKFARVDTAMDTVANVIANRSNGVVFAYGQTGSGKTFTINAFLELVQEAVAMKCDGDVEVQYVQIYNDAVFDLFSSNLRLGREEKRSVFVSPLEIVRLVDSANQARAVAATNMNVASSRSHSLLYMKFGGDKTLCVVDLAGSERVKKSGVTGRALDEAKHINGSLSALIRVLNSRIDPKATHVPVRDCKLTEALEGVFIDEACRVNLYACVAPVKESEYESLSTLKFAAGCTYVGAKKKKAVALGRMKVLSEEERGALEEKRRLTRGAFDGSGCVMTAAGGLFVRGRESDENGDEDVNVVLLHYYGGKCQSDGSFACWDDAALNNIHETLQRKGVNARILVPDFPGHGRSGGALQPAKPERRQFCADGGGVSTVLEILDHFGCHERTVVVGFDWGGGVSVAFCEKHADRAMGVVAWNASWREEAGEDEGQRGWTRQVTEREVVWTESMWHTKAKAEGVARALGLKAAGVECCKKIKSSEAYVLGKIVKVAKAVSAKGR